MTTREIIKQRLTNQQIAAPRCNTSEDVVSWLGAMQAQEYPHAKWAIGLRLPGITDSEVEQAFNDGLILRTHILRPTWHFVAPTDIRWMLKLTAPRVHTVNGFMYRWQELDTKIFKRTNDIIAKALDGNKYLTRTELSAIVERKKITASGIRLAAILMYAELEGIICSGPRSGKQFTYALLDERVPAPGRKFDRKEALGELALRYFSSRSPATVKDFAWWSGLTVKEAMEGVAMLPEQFKSAQINGTAYITTKNIDGGFKAEYATFLLPNFDEYSISYKDRSFLKGSELSHAPLRNNGTSVPSLIIDGQIHGTWKAARVKGKIIIETSPYIPLTKAKEKLVTKAENHYRSFLSTQR